MADAKKAIDKIFKPNDWEGQGVYTNNPADPGGETNSGVTITEARAAGYTGDMKSMPFDFVYKVFTTKFFNALRLDGIDDQDIANQILQAAVNQGAARWGLYIQQICNGLFTHADILLAIDGHPGAHTIAAINKLTLKNKAVFSEAIYNRQEKRYDEIVLKNPGLAWARTGWHNRAKDFLFLT